MEREAEVSRAASVQALPGACHSCFLDFCLISHDPWNTPLLHTHIYHTPFDWISSSRFFFLVIKAHSTRNSNTHCLLHICPSWHGLALSRVLGCNSIIHIPGPGDGLRFICILQSRCGKKKKKPFPIFAESIAVWILPLLANKSCIRVLNPSTLESGLTWRQTLYRGLQIKMRSLGWPLTQHDWYLYWMRKFGEGHTHRENDMWRWRQRLEWYLYKPRDTKDFRKPLQAREEARKRFSLTDLRRNQPILRNTTHSYAIVTRDNCIENRLLGLTEVPYKSTCQAQLWGKQVFFSTFTC